MYFNEKKFKNCIDYLICFKYFIIVCCILLLACTGIVIATYTMNNTEILNYIKEKWLVYTLFSATGAICGLLISFFLTWIIEMKIQESNWKMDILNELKTQSSIASKNTPISKTIVSIKNNSTPGNTEITEN